MGRERALGPASVRRPFASKLASRPAAPGSWNRLRGSVHRRCRKGMPFLPRHENRRGLIFPLCFFDLF